MKQQLEQIQAYNFGADNADGDNAKFYARADGYLSYKGISDSVIPAPANTAGNGRNPSNATLPGLDNNTSAYAAVTSQTSGERLVVVKNLRIRKKAGTTKLIFVFWAKHENQQGDPENITSFNNEVRISGGVGLNDAAANISSTSYQRHTLEAEFSSADLFNDGIERFVELQVYSWVESLNYVGGTDSAETFLNKDLIVLEQSV